MILIDHNGERMLVLNLTGHDGVTVINNKVGPQPSPYHKLNPAGVWIEDAAAKENARLKAMTRSQLLDEAVRRANANRL